MALAANAFFTVADVKAFFPAWTDSDSVLEFIINAVSWEVESFCHDKFVQRQETLVFDGNDKQSMDLGSHVVSVSEVQEGDNFGLNMAVRAQSTQPYGVHPKRGILFSLYKWKFGVQNVQVKALVGWDAVPADLKLSVLRIIKRVHDSKFGFAMMLPTVSETLGAYSYSLAVMGLNMNDVIGSDQATLLRYRRWSIS